MHAIKANIFSPMPCLNWYFRTSPASSSTISLPSYFRDDINLGRGYFYWLISFMLRAAKEISRQSLNAHGKNSVELVCDRLPITTGRLPACVTPLARCAHQSAQVAQRDFPHFLLP